MIKIKSFIKKHVEYIVVVIMCFFTGAWLGSGIDLSWFGIGGLGFPRSYYPYRIPFNNFFIRYGKIAAIAMFLVYLINIAIRKDIKMKDKIMRFFITMLIAVLVAFIVALLWNGMIFLIHDFKRATGISNL